MAGLPLNRAALLTWAFLVCASIATGLLIGGRALGPASALSLILLIAASPLAVLRTGMMTEMTVCSPPGAGSGTRGMPCQACLRRQITRL